MIPDAVDVAADVGDAANVGQPVDESRLHHLDAKGIVRLNRLEPGSKVS